MNAKFVRGLLARKLFQLISKFGMKFVLQGLIEVCERNPGDERMERLAEDLKTAVRHWDGEEEEEG